MIQFPRRDVILGTLRNLMNQIHAPEQHVYFSLPKLDLTGSRRLETILHGMGDWHGNAEIHDCGGAFERVCFAHEVVELNILTTLNSEQSGREDGPPFLDFHPEQLEHRELA